MGKIVERSLNGNLIASDIVDWWNYDTDSFADLTETDIVAYKKYSDNESSGKLGADTDGLDSRKRIRCKSWIVHLGDRKD